MADSITLADDRIELVVEVDGGGVPRLTRLTRLAPAPDKDRGRPGQPGGGQPGALPLADVVLATEGRNWSGRRYCESATPARLRYAGHEHTAGDDSGRPWRRLRVDLADPVTGLRAEVS